MGETQRMSKNKGKKTPVGVVIVVINKEITTEGVRLMELRKTATLRGFWFVERRHIREITGNNNELSRA